MATTEHGTTASFRVNVKLHDMLKNSLANADPLDPIGPVEGGLPEPVYPQRPEIMWKTDRAREHFKAWRTWKGLGAPYFKSRLMPGQLRPLIAYLFS